MVKILLVEDDLTFSKILEGFLQRNGYQVDARQNVKGALRLHTALEVEALVVVTAAKNSAAAAIITAFMLQA